MFVFYLLAAVQVFLSYKSMRGGIEYLRFFRRELARPESDFSPFASIIAPCRGLDEDLEKNLNALFEQDYPRYEIIFVLDSEKDAAFPVIQKVIQSRNHSTHTHQNDIPCRIVIAGKAKNESQKVHNLREAVLHVSDESEIFVFVDSDARPSKKWLRNLTAPLADETIGATTGYRWFISKKRNFASELRAAWNASVASALGANVKSNFCWGGSMALRRATFEKIRMRERWRGTLSDDFAVTRVLKEAGLPIHFVPQALTASVEDCNFRELLEFSTRQMKITRVYSSHLWKASFIGSVIFNLVFVWGIFILFFSSPASFAFIYTSFALFLISAFSAGKSLLRLRAVRLVLKDYERDLKLQFWTQNTLWTLTPAIFFYNSLCALLSREIVWRGIRYRLDSPERTTVAAENGKLNRQI
jgi:Glycosyltransferases, probably involved in cell wall biogenesis